MKQTHKQVPSSLACTGDRLVYSFAGKLESVDLATGEDRWGVDAVRIPPAGAAPEPVAGDGPQCALSNGSPMILRGRKAYFGTNDGLHCVDLEARRMLWTFWCDNPVVHHIDEANGVLFFASTAPMLVSKLEVRDANRTDSVVVDPGFCANYSPDGLAAEDRVSPVKASVLYALRAADPPAPAVQPSPPTRPATVPPSDAQILALINQLGHKDPARAKDAQDRLIEIGPPAGDRLQHTRRPDDAGFQGRCDTALQEISRRVADRQSQDARKNLLWEKRFDESIGPAVVAPGAVYYVCEGKLHAVSLPAGKELWSCRMKAILGRDAAIDGNTIYVASDDNVLYAIDARTGRTVWTYEPEGVIGEFRLAGGRLLLTGSKVGLTAINLKTGKEDWQFTEGTALARPNACGDSAVMVATDRTLYCLDARSGRQKWKVKLRDRPLSVPLFTPGGAHIAMLRKESDPFGGVFAYDPDTGKPLWYNVFESGRELVGPGTIRYYEDGFHGSYSLATWDRKIVLFAAGRLHVFEPATGREEWSCDCLRMHDQLSPKRVDDLSGRTVYSQGAMHVQDGVAYLGSSTGIEAVDLATRRQLWKLWNKEAVYWIVGCPGAVCCVVSRPKTVRTYTQPDRDSYTVLCGSSKFMSTGRLVEGTETAAGDFTLYVFKADAGRGPD